MTKVNDQNIRAGSKINFMTGAVILVAILMRKNAVWITELGLVERRAGNFKKSVDLFKRALGINKNIQTYEFLIQSYYLLGDFEAAEKLSQESHNEYSMQKINSPYRSFSG